MTPARILFHRVARLRPDCVDRYLELHSSPPPELLAAISEIAVENYRIWRYGLTLFATFEYKGTDFESSMINFSTNAVVQEWDSLCRPCLEPFDDNGNLWLEVEPIFDMSAAGADIARVGVEGRT